MTGRGVGRRVVVIRFSPRRALAHQAAQAPFYEQVAVFFKIVVTKLIHDDEKH